MTGVWNSGPGPEELEDLWLMAETGWSWPELQLTPLDVRRRMMTVLRYKPRG